ncbi:hypothetical protein HELRODRAFT_170600 [Helobdella robusta]|uniref:Uncharacterized protein n=1 Tax=Helobdella robusta TaxID=6412 RepID=T1F382_HELRO|nr:hypothetical protein HELRODRAFT_170600 [Helobdella robusta]ESO07272.1 hypothetical protein HELRODRAFT_170600 [Helobdella robusta]
MSATKVTTEATPPTCDNPPKYTDHPEIGFQNQQSYFTYSQQQQQQQHPYFIQTQQYTYHPNYHSQQQQTILPQPGSNASAVVIQIGDPTRDVYLCGSPCCNFTGAIVYSCIIFWCCGWLSGMLAFVMARFHEKGYHKQQFFSLQNYRTSCYSLRELLITMRFNGNKVN